MKKLVLSMGIKFALFMFVCATLLTSCNNKGQVTSTTEYTITGKVVDANGEDINGLTVTITPSQVGSVIVNGSSFLAIFPKADKYTITIEAPGFNPYTYRFYVSDGQNSTQSLKFELKKSGDSHDSHGNGGNAGGGAGGNA